jgi:hypothetical protein
MTEKGKGSKIFCDRISFFSLPFILFCTFSYLLIFGNLYKS